MTRHVTVYGLGGYDPAASDGNIVDEYDETVQPTEQEIATEEFRDAVQAATSVADLRDALLGVNITGRPEVRPA